jgi:hypothetical protein
MKQASSPNTGLSIVQSILAAIIIVAAAAPYLFPARGNSSMPLVVIIVSAVVMLALALAGLQRPPAAAEPVEEELPEQEPQVMAPPPPPQSTAPSPQQALMLLTLLQEKGRFVDFVMEDITAYSEEQVSAAARVVHQGCREVIREAFSPVAVSQSPENGAITLNAGFSAEEYRLVGHIGGSGPYSGTLVHKGWRATQVKLPRPAQEHHSDAPVIVPAEVEL